MTTYAARRTARGVEEEEEELQSREGDDYQGCFFQGRSGALGAGRCTADPDLLVAAVNDSVAAAACHFTVDYIHIHYPSYNLTHSGVQETHCYRLCIPSICYHDHCFDLASQGHTSTAYGCSFIRLLDGHTSRVFWRDLAGTVHECGRK